MRLTLKGRRGDAPRYGAATMSGRLAPLSSKALAGGLRVFEAGRRRERLAGLAGLDAIGEDEALLLPRCRSVHTFGMRFALDLVWLGAHGEVVRVDRDVAPRRLRTCLRARSVVECAAGRADAFVAAGL